MQLQVQATAQACQRQPEAGHCRMQSLVALATAAAALQPPQLRCHPLEMLRPVRLQQVQRHPAQQHRSRPVRLLLLPQVAQAAALRPGMHANLSSRGLGLHQRRQCLQHLLLRRLIVQLVHSPAQTFQMQPAALQALHQTTPQAQELTQWLRLPLPVQLQLLQRCCCRGAC